MKHGEKNPNLCQTYFEEIVKIYIHPCKSGLYRITVSYVCQYQCSKQGCEIVTHSPF